MSFRTSLLLRHFYGRLKSSWPKILSKEIKPLDCTSVAGDVGKIGDHTRRDNEAEMRAGRQTMIREGMEHYRLRRVRQKCSVTILEHVYKEITFRASGKGAQNYRRTFVLGLWP